MCTPLTPPKSATELWGAWTYCHYWTAWLSVITCEILKTFISRDTHAYYACTTHKHIHVCTVTDKIALFLQYTDACTHIHTRDAHAHTRARAHTQSRETLKHLLLACSLNACVCTHTHSDISYTHSVTHTHTHTHARTRTAKQKVYFFIPSPSVQHVWHFCSTLFVQGLRLRTHRPTPCLCIEGKSRPPWKSRRWTPCVFLPLADLARGHPRLKRRQDASFHQSEPRHSLIVALQNQHNTAS